MQHNTAWLSARRSPSISNRGTSFERNPAHPLLHLVAPDSSSVPSRNRRGNCRSASFMHQEYEMPPLQPRRRLEIDRVPMSQAEGVKRISLPVASETTRWILGRRRKTIVRFREVTLMDTRIMVQSQLPHHTRSAVPTSRSPMATTWRLHLIAPGAVDQMTICNA